MIRLRIAEIIEEQGRSPYSVQKPLGMSFNAFRKLLNNQTRYIHFDTIDALTDILGVTPGDLFVKEYEDDTLRRRHFVRGHEPSGPVEE